MTDAPDRVWKITPLARSLIDLAHMIEGPPHDSFFRSRETIAAMHAEQKRLAKTLHISYVATGLLAFFILLGAPSPDTKISAFGIEAPLNILPLQVLAIFMAGMFGFYATQFMSFLILSQTIGKVLSLERPDSWQFLSAPFDASTLWSSIIGPKTIGYQSPRRTLFLGVLVIVVSFGTVLTHAVIVAVAAGSAAWQAWNGGGWISIGLGVGATVIVVAATLAFIAAVAWPVPHRWLENVPLADSDETS